MFHYTKLWFRSMSVLIALVLWAVVSMFTAQIVLAHGGHTYCGTGTHKPNWYTKEVAFSTTGPYHEYEIYKFGLYMGTKMRYCL